MDICSATAALRRSPTDELTPELCAATLLAVLVTRASRDWMPCQKISCVVFIGVR